MGTNTKGESMAFSIKQSFADCISCPLLDCPSCILETNATYLDEVEIVFVSENPGKDEVEAQVPLIGKSGQTFRRFFKKYGLDKLKYLLTNIVLCQTINKDGTTGNPEDNVIERCKENAFQIIRACNPKLIVLMGASPMKGFGIAEMGVTNLRGQMFKWENWDVLLTVHPSFVNRQRSYEAKFDDDFKKASEIMGIQSQQVVQASHTGKSGVHFYKIPEKYYADDYRLVDVQFLKNAKETLYIFRNKENKKEFHKESDSYVCYQTPDGVNGKKLTNYDDLVQITLPYAQKIRLKGDITYEGDLKITTKHSQDYYLQSKGEPSDSETNIMFLDIEIYKDGNEFPDVKEAVDPITIISYAYHGKITTYVLDNKVLLKDKSLDDIKAGENVVVFKNERDLLSKFVKDIRDIEPDFIAGWNVIRFDMEYISNRSKKIGVPLSAMSKFSEVEIDGVQGFADIAGMNVVDQLELYKKFTFGLKENYRLGTIAELELGETKLDVGRTFADKFKKDVNAAIDYSIRDVSLLVKLEKKLRHISLQNEIRKICKSSFKTSVGILSSLDSLITSFLKERGIASRNADVHEEDKKFEGAFVKESRVGIHDYVVDFDFTSLYPSLIMTYNIGINTFVMKLKDYQQGYDFLYDFEHMPEKVTVIVDPIQKNQEMVVTKHELLKKMKDNNLVCSINGCFFKSHEQEMSIYSEVLDMLMKSRKAYKKKALEAKEKKATMKDQESKEYKELDQVESLNDNRQMVYKILANAIYGVLGNHVFRFFNTDCARTVTLSGQEAIKTAIVEGNNFVDYLKHLEKLQSPEKLTKKEMYGDLERDTRHVITGDTDSLFVTYENTIENDEDTKLIGAWSSMIQGNLNQKIIKDMVLNHNVKENFNRLELKNELVIKRGLFLAKKRYALYVINQEGKKVEEVQSKGLEIRRSDFPSFSKDCIVELLDLILKSDKVTISKINTFVKSKEKDFIERIKNGDKSIARPVAWTKKIEDYKVLSQGVKSMLAWNNLLYKIHNVGSKGYLFKIKGLDMEKAPANVVENYNKHFIEKGIKLEVIALPDEEERLPAYFVIDVRDMLKFAWEDRYNLLLEPLTKVKEEQILTF